MSGGQSRGWLEFMLLNPSLHPYIIKKWHANHFLVQHVRLTLLTLMIMLMYNKVIVSLNKVFLLYKHLLLEHHVGKDQVWESFLL